MKNKKIIAMDMDGTLTQHKSPLEPECRTVLEKLSKKYRLLMVCAGGCERVYRQLEAFDIDISGFYGMQYAQTKNGILNITESIAVQTDREKVISIGKKIRGKFGFHNFDGDAIEFHASGLITFPILGTKASLKDKLAYDPDRSKRRACYKEVCKLFEDYNVFIGGTSSFDIAPKPYNKLYALECYLKRNCLNHEDVVFFGDDYGVGGNDSCVYESDISFVKIDNYRDFPQVAAELLLV